MRAQLERIKQTGFRYIVFDTLDDEDLAVIAEATDEMVLVTGGSGLAIGITEVLNRTHGISRDEGSAFTPLVHPAVIISGSCSAQTNIQVAHYRNLRRGASRRKAASHRRRSCRGSASWCSPQ